jgi:hypothetical protein
LLDKDNSGVVEWEEYRQVHAEIGEPIEQVIRSSRYFKMELSKSAVFLPFRR